MESLLAFSINAFVTYFAIIHLVRLVPVVIGSTSHLSPPQRNVIITRANLFSMGIMAFFALVGRFLLSDQGHARHSVYLNGITLYAHGAGFLK